mmetsp:Transcript_23171/g.54230  ORF Transcript_23171/g.54230 Transcript_23171/m.54230 type:complete len:195 (-) Transcript_23171:56-640(-)
MAEEDPWGIERQRADSVESCRIVMLRGRSWPMLLFLGHEDAFFGHCTFFLRNRWDEECANGEMTDYQGMMTLMPGSRLRALHDRVDMDFEKICVEAEAAGDVAPDVPQRPYPELDDDHLVRLKSVVIPFVRLCDQAAHQEGGEPQEHWARLAGVDLGEWEAPESLEHEEWEKQRAVVVRDAALRRELFSALGMI